MYIILIHVLNAKLPPMLPPILLPIRNVHWYVTKHFRNNMQTGIDWFVIFYYYWRILNTINVYYAHSCTQSEIISRNAFINVFYWDFESQSKLCTKASYDLLYARRYTVCLLLRTSCNWTAVITCKASKRKTQVLLWFKSKNYLKCSLQISV